MSNIQNGLLNLVPTSGSIFLFEDVVTLTCDNGFWVLMDGGRRTVEFTCSADGNFQPDPRRTQCTGKDRCIMRAYLAHLKLCALFV